MRPELHAVRDSTLRFREVAKRRADAYPKALTLSGVAGAWRVTVSARGEE